MAEGQFDLLLTVGADISALRAQLAQISRELNIEPVKVNVETQGSQQASQALNEVSRALANAKRELSELQSKIAAGLWSVNVEKGQTVAIAKEYSDRAKAAKKAADEVVAAQEEAFEAQKKLGAEMAADTLKQGRLAAQIETDRRRLSKETADQRIADENRVAQQISRNAQLIEQARSRNYTGQLRQLSDLEQYYAKLSALQQRAAFVPQPLAQRVASFNAALGGEQQGLLAGAPPQSAEAVRKTRSEFEALRKELELLPGVTSKNEGAFTGFFEKLGRYAQIAVGLTVVYGTMRAVFAGVQEFVEVDRQLARIAATMDNNADRATVLRDSYQLMIDANKALGISFAEAGKVVFELEKALGNSSEQVRAAFLPALTLASLGEGNQTEILRTLVGVYKLFGETLDNATTPQQKYLAISDKLIASSAASIQDIDGFRTALQNVAPVAKGAGVSLDTTLAALVQLTNGMQSASRAGTGFRQLLVDLQTRPAQIAKTFGVAFDPDAPLNATKLLDNVIRKIRELGTESVKSQALINSAFPDKRATLALETLVELYPQYSKVLNEVEESAGRTAKAQQELANTLSAAAGRLSGALFNEFTQTINTLSGVKPGQADGMVGFLDVITRAVIIAGRELRKYIDDVQKILNLANNLTGGKAGQAAQSAAAADITGAGLLALASPQAAARLLKPPSPAAVQAQQEATARASREAAAADAAARNLEGVPDDERVNALKRNASLTAELTKRKNELRAAIENEFVLNDRSLSYARRIAAADALVAQRTQERIRAEADYDLTASLTPRDIANLEKYQGELRTAMEAERRARNQAQELRREDANENISIGEALARQTEQNAQKVQGVFARITAEEAKLKDISSLDRAILEYRKFTDILQDAQFQPLTPEQFSEINQRISSIGSSILQYWVDPLLDITRLDYENTWDKFERGLKKAIEDAEKLAGITSKISGRAAPTAAQVEERSIERQLGLDTVNNQLQKLQNEIGFTKDEWVANLAAMKAGAKDFADLLRQINDESLPPEERERKRTAATIIQTRIIPENRELTSAQIQAQAQNEQNRLLGLQEGYGRVGAELEKYILARDKYRDSFDNLTPKQRQEIELLARTTEELRNAAAAAGLVRLGFSPDDASSIARQAGNIAQVEQQTQAGLEALRRLNDAQRVAREQQEQFIQEQARATGNFVAFFISSLRSAAVAAGDFWDNLKTLAEDTAKAMSNAFSDLFFNTFQGQLDNGKEAWKNFLGSMERALADFMSKQLVKSFLNIITGGEPAAGGGGAPISQATGLLGGVAGGIGGLTSNFQGNGVSGALFGLPATPSTVNYSTQSNPDLEFAGLAPTSVQVPGRPTTTGLIGNGGTISRDVQTAAAIAAAYTASQSVIKLTSDLSTQAQRNAGTGGLAGTAAGGILGALLGGQAGASLGAGAGGLLGNYLGGLFGSNQAPQQRFDEFNRTLNVAQTTLEVAVTASKSFNELFATLRNFQSGAPGAAATGVPVNVAVGGVPINNFTQSQFLSAVRANPAALTANVQAGVSPELLGPLNQEVVNGILAKVQALDDINRQINQTMAEILAETVTPTPTGATSLETLKQQAVDFRAVVDQLIQTNVEQTAALEQQLAQTTDPALILTYTQTIKGLIEQRYQDETQLVQQFAGQLDQLGSSLKSVSESIDKQIFDLQLSNFGPTNPLQGLTLAQGKFNEAKAAFEASPTPENAQAVQALVDPLLNAASQVFTRPSPEYREIFDNVISTLEQVKGSVDQQAADINTSLQAALGTSVSIQDLTQKNTASMAADMKTLLALVQQQANLAGVNNAGAGILLPGTFPTTSGQVQPQPNPTQAGTGSQTGALAAAGGVLAGLGPLVGVADKLGASDALKSLLNNLFSSSGITPGESSQLLPSGGQSITNPDVLGASYYNSFNSIDIGNYTALTPDLVNTYGADSTLGLFGFQYGGKVPGSGSGDTVPAMLEPGEFVLPKRIAGPMMPWLENLVGHRRNVPMGHGGFHMAEGGVVPALTQQDIQILVYLSNLLNQASGQSQTQGQIAANTQATAETLAKIAQQAGVQASATTSAPITIAPPSASPSTPATVSAGTATTQSLNDPSDATATLQQILLAASLGRNATALGGTLLGRGALATNLNAGLNTIIGGVNLAQGISSGNLLQTIGGGLGLAGGLTGFTPSQLALNDILGVIGSGSTALSGGALVSSVLSGAAGGLGLYSSINSIIQNGVSAGNIANAVLSAYQLYAAASPVVSALTGTAVPTFGTLAAGALVATAPELAAALVNTFVATGTATASTVTAAGVSTALGAASVVAAPIVLAVVSWIQEHEKSQALKSGWLNNPIVGSLYGAATAAIGRSDQLESAVQQFGGLSALSNEDLIRVIGSYTNNLLPFYYTAQGGVEPLRAINATGTSETLSTAAFTAKQNQILNNYSLAVAELKRRGLSLNALSGLAIAPQFGGLTQTVPTAAFAASLGAISPSAGFGAGIGGIGTSPGLAAISSATFSPEAAAEATGSPAAAALAYLNPTLFTQAGGTTDLSGPITQAEIDRLLQAAALIDAQAYQAFTSGGGGATGGWVRGGISGRDSVPAVLMPNEYIIPAPAAERIETRLEQIFSEGLVRFGGGDAVSTAARGGNYRNEGGVSTIALNIHEGAVRIDGARDAEVTARKVIDAIEQNIRSGRLGKVISDRVRRN